jgi:GNAT superfamily N-acetyltransferase
MTHSHSGGPTADVSVRVAWADDADAIAAVQVRAWPELYAGLLPAEAFPADVEALAARWRQSLARPADARNRVLVALERNRVVGFALTFPAADPDCDPVADGELAEVTLDPAERAKGHGSRLLQAAVDTLAADRFSRAVTRVNSATRCAPSSPRPAGPPTRPTVSSTSTAPARRRSSRSGSTPRSPDRHETHPCACLIFL